MRSPLRPSSPRSPSARSSGRAVVNRRRHHGAPDNPAPGLAGLGDPFAPFRGGDESPAPAAASAAAPFAVLSVDGERLALSRERQELLCSVIGLLVKLGLIAVAGVSLMRLAGAYQQRMERQGEITAVLELETAKLAKSRERFDTLFRIEGEQRLIREQSQWIAPNRMRVVWQDSGSFASAPAAAVRAEARQELALKPGGHRP